MERHEELFKKYESIASKFAGKVYNQRFIGIDKEDVKQEFRIKLYETILAYDRSIKRREEKGMIRPVPLPYYINSALSNFVKDYIKKINEAQEVFKESNGHSTYSDFSIYSKDLVEIDTDANVYILNGFDLLEPLEGFERACFCMWLKGTSLTSLHKTFGKKINVHNVISEHKNYLKSKRELFEVENVSEILCSSHIETY